MVFQFGLFTSVFLPLIFWPSVFLPLVFLPLAFWPSVFQSWPKHLILFGFTKLISLLMSCLNRIKYYCFQMLFISTEWSWIFPDANCFHIWIRNLCFLPEIEKPQKNFAISCSKTFKKYFLEFFNFRLYYFYFKPSVMKVLFVNYLKRVKKSTQFLKAFLFVVYFTLFY